MLPSIFCIVSRTIDDDASNNSESTVDMIAESTMTSSTPVSKGGNNSLASVGKICSLSAKAGNSARPAIPAVTAPKSSTNRTRIETIRAFLSSDSSRADM